MIRFILKKKEKKKDQIKYVSLDSPGCKGIP